LEKNSNYDVVNLHRPNVVSLSGFCIIIPFNNKFKRILYIILKNEYHEDLYKLEDTHVTAMKFLGRKCKNARIYCKEIFIDGKKIVMVSPYFKKVKKNQDDPGIINIIDKIKTYEYEF
jgi:hypothetical protein